MRICLGLRKCGDQPTTLATFSEVTLSYVPFPSHIYRRRIIYCFHDALGIPVIVVGRMKAFHCCFVFVLLRIKPRASPALGRISTSELHSQLPKASFKSQIKEKNILIFLPLY